MKPGALTTGRIYAALRMLGFDRSAEAFRGESQKLSATGGASSRIHAEEGEERRLVPFAAIVVSCMVSPFLFGAWHFVLYRKSTEEGDAFPQNRFKNAQPSATPRQRRKNWGTSKPCRG